MSDDSQTSQPAPGTAERKELLRQAADSFLALFNPGGRTPTSNDVHHASPLFDTSDIISKLRELQELEGFYRHLETALVDGYHGRRTYQSILDEFGDSPKTWSALSAMAHARRNT